MSIFQALKGFCGLSDADLFPNIEFSSFFVGGEEEKGFMAFLDKNYTTQSMELVNVLIIDGVPDNSTGKGWLERAIARYRSESKSVIETPEVEAVVETTKTPEVEAVVETPEVEPSFEEKVAATLSSLPVHAGLIAEYVDLNSSISSLEAELQTAKEGQEIINCVNDALVQMDTQIDTLIQTEESLIVKVDAAKTELSGALKQAHQNSSEILNKLKSRRARKA